MPACPACGKTQIEEASPATRTTRAGGTQVVAHRLRCLACGYTDRTVNFKGALSLNNVVTHDGPAIPEDTDA